MSRLSYNAPKGQASFALFKVRDNPKKVLVDCTSSLSCERELRKNTETNLMGAQTGSQKPDMQFRGGWSKTWHTLSSLSSAQH